MKGGCCCGFHMSPSSSIYPVSSPADALLSYLLNDKPTFRKMVALNQARLADSAAHVRDWFEKRGFKPFQSNA